MFDIGLLVPIFTVMGNFLNFCLELLYPCTRWPAGLCPPCPSHNCYATGLSNKRLSIKHFTPSRKIMFSEQNFEWRPWPNLILAFEVITYQTSISKHHWKDASSNHDQVATTTHHWMNGHRRTGSHKLEPIQTVGGLSRWYEIRRNGQLSQTHWRIEHWARAQPPRFSTISFLIQFSWIQLVQFT